MRQVSGKLAVASLASAFLFIGCAGKSESDGDDDDGTSVGSSGVPRGKNLEDLTDDEKRRLCAWAVPQEGGPGEKDCDGNMLSTPTVEECAQAEFGFPCSVGLVEDCIRTLHGDACNLFVTDECLAYLECALGSGE